MRHPFPSVLATLLLGLVAAPRAAALELRQDPTGLTASQRARAEAVVGDVASRLPPRWRQALGAVTIEWTEGLPREVHGRALRGRVLLRRALLDAPDAGRAHPAAAALVHELAHVLDRAPQGGLSREPRLLDLAGWQARAPAGRMRRSGFRDRSPDPYELESPREFVAVNLEHFLLDPEYGCRRPALWRHFAERLDAAAPRADCAPGHAFVESDATARADASPLLHVDPARVAGVDVLLAEPGTAAMSRWGHVMLRLVVCAPGRARGPGCRLDLAHHRVLSFRAFVDDVQISSWRGLTGAYPSRLFVLPLSQVIDEYTKVEMRGLRSVPLRLSDAGIAALVEHAAQLHWSYDGRYRFVTNNCAVETWRLLRDGLPDSGLDEKASLTPTGLLARLERAGLADGAVLQDRAAATVAGFYFPSQREYYAALFDVAGHALALPARDVEQWLELPPAERAGWIERADLRAAAAMLVLEGAALRRLELRATDVLKRTLSARGRAREAMLDDALMAADRLTRPASMLPQGYGLPQQEERDRLALDAAALAERWRGASAGLRARARAALPASTRARLDQSEANLAALGARLRELDRASGGLDLGDAH